MHKDISGEPIVHEYLAGSSQANNVVYSVQAAQLAFLELSRELVALGHFQEGDDAWAIAQRRAVRPGFRDKLR